MNRVLRATRKTTESRSILAMALACSLTLSACASPVAPSAKPANFYETVRNDVEKFWTDFFSSHSLTYKPITKMQLFDRQIVACGKLNLGPFYCGGVDRSVYLESAFMQGELSDVGDFAAAVVIAHEIGHHTQDLLGLLGTYSIVIELQADCLAGGWMKDAGGRGLLQVSDPQEAAISLFNVGDRAGTPWFASDAHGSPQDRVQAFQIGLHSGVQSCFF